MHGHKAHSCSIIDERATETVVSSSTHPYRDGTGTQKVDFMEKTAPAASS